MGCLTTPWRPGTHSLGARPGGTYSASGVCTHGALRQAPIYCSASQWGTYTGTHSAPGILWKGTRGVGAKLGRLQQT
jgi:hypothetical protein